MHKRKKIHEKGEFNALSRYSKMLADTQKLIYPTSKASREVANLTERKNPHTPVYGVK